MKALHARVEIEQPDSDAGDADDGQAGPVALALDQQPFFNVQVERVGEDVDGIEANFLGHADAVGGVLAGLSPGGVDEAEFHGSYSILFHPTSGTPLVVSSPLDSISGSRNSSASARKRCRRKRWGENHGGCISWNPGRITFRHCAG